MTVTLTSPCMGLEVGATYTGPGEAWLITQGYAKNADSGDVDTLPDDLPYAASFTPAPGNDNQTDYTGVIGPDGFNTLASGGEALGVLPADDLTDAANREDPRWPADEGEFDGMANDAANLNDAKFPHTPDYDLGGVDNDAPSNLSIDPAEGPATGGTVVTISGDNLVGVTSVTFDGVAGTALDTSQAETAGEIKVTTPAGTAGPADVVVVDPSGNGSLPAGFTYTA